jgi:hypothetical protein
MSCAHWDYTVKITALPLFGKNSSLDFRIKNIKNNDLHAMDMNGYGK